MLSSTKRFSPAQQGEQKIPSILSIKSIPNKTRMIKHPKSPDQQGQNSRHGLSRRDTTSIDSARESGRPRTSAEYEPQLALNVSGPLIERRIIDDHTVSEKAIPAPVLSGNDNEMRTMGLNRLSRRSYARWCTVIPCALDLPPALCSFFWPSYSILNSLFRSAPFLSAAVCLAPSRCSSDPLSAAARDLQVHSLQFLFLL